MKLLESFRQEARSERGQTMAEYAVILSVITLAAVFALTALSGAISTSIASLAGQI